MLFNVEEKRKASLLIEISLLNKEISGLTKNKDILLSEIREQRRWQEETKIRKTEDIFTKSVYFESLKLEIHNSIITKGILRKEIEKLSMNQKYMDEQIKSKQAKIDKQNKIKLIDKVKENKKINSDLQKGREKVVLIDNEVRQMNDKLLNLDEILQNNKKELDCIKKDVDKNQKIKKDIEKFIKQQNISPEDIKFKKKKRGRK